MSKVTKFSVPESDLRWDTFRAGGKGGQNQNKRDSGARVTHIPSGAVGESREERSQLQNKKTAIERMTKTKVFVTWAKMQIALIEEGYQNIEKKLDTLMKDENMEVELGVPSKPGDINGQDD